MAVKQSPFSYMNDTSPGSPFNFLFVDFSKWDLIASA